MRIWTYSCQPSPASSSLLAFISLFSLLALLPLFALSLVALFYVSPSASKCAMRQSPGGASTAGLKTKVGAEAFAHTRSPHGSVCRCA